MQTTISQRQLRNDSGAIMRRVEAGETFTVTRNGTPVAQLAPHDASVDARAPRFVPVDQIAAGRETLPDWGTAGFADDLAALDRLVDDRDVDRWGER